jgi:hypothetical protein
VGSLFKITTFIESIATWKEKAELPLQLKKGISLMYVDVPPLVSVEAHLLVNKKFF